MSRTDSHLVSANLMGWILVLVLLLPFASGFAQSKEMFPAARALYRGDYEKARALAASHLQKKPADILVRITLARADLALGKFAEAIAELNRVLASDPRNVDGLYYLSFAARALSQQEYAKLYRLDPNSARVHQLMAESAMEAQDMSEAETEFQKALEVNPQSAEIAIELAELKRSQSKFDEAIAYYSKAAEIGSLDYEIAYGLGACYTYKQDYPHAIEWLRKSVALAPDSAAGHFGLGNALFQNGELNAAIPELIAAVRLEGGMKQAYFLLARAYSKLGRKQEANSALQKLDQLNNQAVPAQKSGDSNGMNKETTHEP
jgi:predicted Zn-dependent protease